MTAPVSLEQAWQRLFALVRPLESETVPVDQAAGRYLAEPLAALRTQPAADMSAMDGFAVAGPGPWRIVGEARAGLPHGGTIAPGEATRISTGAACPGGTQAIVLVEDAAVDGALLTAPVPAPGLHIRPRGFDFISGAALVEAGTRLRPATLALARAAGHGEVRVSRRPSVAIVECGDELVADPRECPPDRLPASNGAMVAAMVAGDSAAVRRIGPVPDDRAALAQALDAHADADVLVTTAGASVGEHDHVRGALEDCGAQLEFWRIAVRPGKPLLVARRGAQIVLGLPGNPASSYVTAFLFVLPLLRAMQGAAHALPVPFALPLASPAPAGDARREFLRARFVDGRVEPIDERDSSALRGLAAAELLIDRPVGAAPARPGEMVSCYWLGNGGIA